MASLNYRPDIDGLRGISVLAVILFHAGQLSFSGGYLGVDVFFVISGYLITTIIATEIQRGQFTVSKFYERRARRILPALVVMVLLTMAPAYLYLLPQDLVAFAKSVVAVSTFTSNFLFAGRLGYFDQSAHLDPMLHTWSLAVEEQFYLIFPLLLVATWRWYRHRVVWIVAAIAVISLSLTLGQLNKNPAFVFFQLIARAWELLAGALVTLGMGRVPAEHLKPATREFGGALGLVLVLTSFFVFDESPAPWAAHNLMPVIGACLLLMCASDTYVGRLLSNRVIVFVGVISYSAYLWHQPLFAFARYVGLAEKSELWFSLVMVSLLMGYISYRWVEQPFRRKGFLSRQGVLTSSLTALVLMAGIAACTIQKHGFPERLPPGIEWRSLGEKLESVGDVCTMQPVAGYTGVEACKFGQPDGHRVIALYGDSHAQAISYELDRQLKLQGAAGVWIRAKGCHIVPTIVENGDISQMPTCRSAFLELQRYVREQVSGIVIASRWTMRLFPIPGLIDALSFDNGEGGVEYNRYRTYAAVAENGYIDGGAEAKRAAVTAFLRALDDTGKPSVLIYPIPELGWDIAKVNFHAGAMLDTLSTSKAEYLSRNAFVLSVFDDFKPHYLIKLPVADVYCDATRCFGQRDGVPLYYDDDHLSTAGARPLVEKVLQAMP